MLWSRLRQGASDKKQIECRRRLIVAVAVAIFVRNGFQVAIKEVPTLIPLIRGGLEGLMLSLERGEIKINLIRD